jgi:DNA-binding NarL/FixJ family response regulator
VTGYRVVVADDHRLTLVAVADSLTMHGLAVAETASTPRGAIEAVIKHRPDALVIDLDLGLGPTGIDVAVHLRQSQPLLGIVILSAYGDPRLLSLELPEAPGGTVYVIKQAVSETQEIVDAVESAIDRARSHDQGSVLPRVDLTRSQVAVLSLVAEGLSNAGISARLFITEESVAKIIGRLLKRLGITAGGDLNTRAALAHRYFDFVGHRRES